MNIANDCLRKIFAHLIVRQVLNIRRVCHAWKQTIDSWETYFETLDISYDVETCPIRMSVISLHVPPAKIIRLPAPFYQHTKRVTISADPEASKQLIKMNLDLFANITSMELDLKIRAFQDEADVSWFLRKFGPNIVSFRLTIRRLINVEYMVDVIKNNLGDNCPLWLRLKTKSEPDNYKYDILAEDSRLVGWTEIAYGSGIAPRPFKLLNSNISKDRPLFEYFIIPSCNWNICLDINLRLGHYKDTLNSLVILPDVLAWESPNLSDLLDNLPNLRNLEIYWSLCASRYEPSLDLKSAAGRITSLILREPPTITYLTSVFQSTTFSRLLYFKYASTTIQSSSVIALLRWMPVLERLYIVSASREISDIMVLHGICNYTNARITEWKGLSDNLIIQLTKGVTIFNCIAQKFIYDVYSPTPRIHCLVRRCIVQHKIVSDSVTSKRQRIE